MLFGGVRVKIQSKLSMAGITALSGLAMLGAGSFALFTADAHSSQQNFGAGVVDITLHGESNVFSNVKEIPYFNMVPGDRAGGYVILHNTGSVAEILDLQNNVHGPIFWDDGLNNGKVVTLNGFVKGSSQELNQQALLADSPFGRTVYQTYKNNWQPRLLIGGPKLIPGFGYESVDYHGSSPLNEYQTDNHPAYYVLQYAIYNSLPKVVEAPHEYPQAIGYRVSGSIVNTNLSVPYTYQQAGYNLNGGDFSDSTGTLNVESSDASFDNELIQPTKFSGSTDLKGIVLQPGQYLLVTYRGGLPKEAGNDYQDAWGSVSLSVLAEQYENNHQNIQVTGSNGNGGNPIQSGQGSTTSPTPNQYFSSLNANPFSSSTIYAGQNVNYTLQLWDSSHSPLEVPVSDISLSVTKGTAKDVVFSPIDSLGNGFYSFSVSDSQAEILQVEATVMANGVSVHAESKPIQLAVDHSILSSLSFDQSSEQAGQSDTYTLSLKNAANQPLQGLTSDISLSTIKGTAQDIEFGPIVEKSPGLYQFSVKDTKSELIQVKATINALDTEQSVTASEEQITPGPAAQLIFYPDYLDFATENSRIPVTISLEDKYGNIVPQNDVLTFHYQGPFNIIGVDGYAQLTNGVFHGTAINQFNPTYSNYMYQYSQLPTGYFFAILGDSNSVSDNSNGLNATFSGELSPQSPSSGEGGGCGCLF